MACVCCSAEGTQVPVEQVPDATPVLEEEPPPPAKFSVMIIGARGIRNTDWVKGSDDKPDCYCEVKCGGEDVYRTKIIQNSMVPRWEEEFEYEDGAELEFTVWDKDDSKSDLLGKVVLNITQDSFKEGCNQEFLMKEAGDKYKAYLGLKIKWPDNDYPAGPPSTFEVTVEKGDGIDYGLDVDSQDGKHLQIYNVDVGAFANYNKEKDIFWQVMPSDFIVSVNSMTGYQAMKAQFKDEQKVTVKLVRAFDCAVVLELGSSDSKKHGLSFPAKMKNDVLVVMQTGDGYIKEYNERC